MKKHLSLGVIVAFAYTTLCYITLIFVPEFIEDPKIHAEVTILLATNVCLGLLFLYSKYTEVENNNQHHKNREALLDLVQVLKQTNAVQEDLSHKLAQLSLNVYTTSCAVERVEKQTKPKTPTPRKKKEA